VLRRHEGELPDESIVRDALSGFLGEVDQVPPRYSAVKRGGVPLHRLAREGRTVEPPPPKRIRIERLVLHKYAPPDLEIEVECSPGTYVRALARDLGDRLGCGGHLRWLRRTRSGPFDLAQARGEAQLARAAETGEIEALLIPPVNALGLPVLRLADHEVERVCHGGDLPAPDARLAPGRRVAALGPDGELLALLEMRPGRQLRPLRVLRPVARPR
jgi:tRNA pseudouridine55 synthase